YRRPGRRRVLGYGITGSRHPCSDGKISRCSSPCCRLIGLLCVHHQSPKPQFHSLTVIRSSVTRITAKLLDPCFEAPTLYTSMPNQSYMPEPWKWPWNSPTMLKSCST